MLSRPFTLPFMVLGTLVLLAGCTVQTGWRRPDPWPLSVRYESSWRESSAPRQPTSPPVLQLDEAEVAERLAGAQREAQQAASEAARLRAEVTTQPTLVAAVRGARAAFAAGRPEVAAAWIDSHPRFWDWSAAGSVVAIEARFVRVGEGLLELTLTRRPGVEGPLAVAFPPGTYAVALDGASPGARPEPAPREEQRLEALLTDLHAGSAERRFTDPESERRWGHWPPAQDLALLEAPVVALEGGLSRTCVLVPVACAVFDRPAPEPGRSYRLDAFGAESAPARLLARLASRPADPREAQLALWLAREDLPWESFVERGGHQGQIVEFQDGRAVLPRHAPGAARLLLDAGLDPRGGRFFAPLERPAPPAELVPAPEAADDETVRGPAPRGEFLAWSGR